MQFQPLLSGGMAGGFQRNVCVGTFDIIGQSPLGAMSDNPMSESRARSALLL